MRKGDPPLNPTGRNQYTYRGDFERAIDALLASRPTPGERTGVVKALAKHFGRGRNALVAAELALAALPHDATRGELAAFLHSFAVLVSPGHPILTPRLWAQAPLEIDHAGELVVTVEAREAVVRRLDRWLDAAKRDAAEKARAEASNDLGKAATPAGAA